MPKSVQPGIGLVDKAGATIRSNQNYGEPTPLLLLEMPCNQNRFAGNFVVRRQM